MLQSAQKREVNKRVLTLLLIGGSAVLEAGRVKPTSLDR